MPDPGTGQRAIGGGQRGDAEPGEGCTYVLTAALPTVPQDLTINGNHASGDGAGINAFDNSQVFVTGTTISGNRADRDGGGIASLGEEGDFSSFTDSTISGPAEAAFTTRNLSTCRVPRSPATGRPAGGGIYDDGPEAMVTLTHSSPAGNRPDNCEPPGSITGCTG